jgi:hypothetical protein
MMAPKKKPSAASIAKEIKDNQAKLNELVKQSAKSSASGVTGTRTDASYMAEGYSGTSTTGKRYINGKLATDAEWQQFINPNANSGKLPGTDYEKTSAYDMLTLELNNLGLSSLIGPLKGLFQQGITDSDTLRLKLSETPEYKTRFSANAERIKKGLTALTPAQYLAKEDAYQNIMRQYGLPASYYTKDSTGKQAGFDQLLSNDVSAVELEDRVMQAQNRVVNSNPEVAQALRSFYPDITNGDILAYTLDPKNALDAIKRKVTAAEIGGAALSAGLTTGLASAEGLAQLGVDKAAARQGYGQIAEMLPRASMLSDIYNQGPYNQATAEAEIFNTTGAASATAKRKKISELEKSAFSGSSGTANNALSRDRAMGNQGIGTSGAGAF